MLQFASVLYHSLLGPVLVARLQKISKSGRENPENGHGNGVKFRTLNPEEKSEIGIQSRD